MTNSDSTVSARKALAYPFLGRRDAAALVSLLLLLEVLSRPPCLLELPPFRMKMAAFLSPAFSAAMTASALNCSVSSRNLPSASMPTTLSDDLH